jgi:hypothetical protein
VLFTKSAKDAPVSRAVQAVGRIFQTPILGGLHRHYVRIDFREGQETQTEVLRATHEAALANCSLADLKHFAVDLA